MRWSIHLEMLSFNRVAQSTAQSPGEGVPGLQAFLEAPFSVGWTPRCMGSRLRMPPRAGG